LARPSIPIDEKQLRALMRLKPTLEDCAAFFECSTSKIEKHIKENWGLRFSEFREQNMVHTRFMLVRTALEKAKKGDTAILIFCLKNLCQWKDRYDHSPDQNTAVIPLAYVPKSIREEAKKEVEAVATRIEAETDAD
jgi:hypothetical protein